MYLRPLQLNELESITSDTNNDTVFPSIGSVRKRENKDHNSMSKDNDGSEQHRKLSFLLWSNSTFEGEIDSDRLHFRTGRWSDDETVYVDQIIRLFDGGYLALPNGIKLNELLRDMLLCKSSRLTKKMKNAKLSTRSYRMETDNAQDLFFSHLSRAQDNFLKTINCPVTRRVIRFNITRMWRIHFSNFCLQASYDKLSTQDWNASLEDMKGRIKHAEEAYRRVKRIKLESVQVSMKKQKISQPSAHPALVHSLPNSTEMDKNSSERFPIQMTSVTYPEYDTMSDSKYLKPTKTFQAKSQCDNFENAPIYQPEEKDDFWIGIFDLDEDHVADTSNKRSEEKSVEYSSDATKNVSSLCSELHATNCDRNQSDKLSSSNHEFENISSKRTYLESLMNFVETEDFPFHYIDAWVPCLSTNDLSVCLSSKKETNCTDSLTLIHAGDFKRSCISSEENLFLEKYGSYSKKISFDNGQGLPGRVYLTGSAIWEHRIRDQDPNLFLNTKDECILGIETVIALPVQSSKVGLMVVVLHSLDHVDEDPKITKKLTSFLHRFDPQPIWSIDINLPEKSSNQGSSTKQTYFSSDKIVESYNKRTQITALDAVTLANLLAEYMPVDKKSSIMSSPSSMSPLSTFISLRSLLLRYPVGCIDMDKALLVILKESYDGYIKTNMDKSIIAHQLVRDWMHLKSDGSSYWGGDVMHLSTSLIFDTNPQSSDNLVTEAIKKPCTIQIRNLPASVSSDFEKFKRW
jgi:hypothetical protein